MVDSQECGIDQIIYGICSLLQKVHKVLSNCQSEYILAKEECEVYLEPEVWRKPQTLKRDAHMFSSVKNYKSK